jgi:hypothetical protein
MRVSMKLSGWWESVGHLVRGRLPGRVSYCHGFGNGFVLIGKRGWGDDGRWWLITIARDLSVWKKKHAYDVKWSRDEWMCGIECWSIDKRETYFLWDVDNVLIKRYRPGLREWEESGDAGCFMGCRRVSFKYPSLSVEIDGLGDRQRSRESDDPGIGEDQEDRRRRIRSLVKKRG